MSAQELGSLARVDPRLVWPNEAHHFTPWLAQHLELLGQALGLDLEFLDRERDHGDFSMDILAKDLGRDRVVVIENQLEPTDHTHLGQLITYAAGVDAGAVIWVCREFRDEHRQALDWLNRGLGAKTEFFGVVVELLQIDSSRPAASFRPVAFPNDWSPRSGPRPDAVEPTSKQTAYQRFFQRLIDELREKHRFTNARAGQPQNWYTFSAGTRGFGYGVSFAQGGQVRAELYIDTENADRNQALLEKLRAEKAAIEGELGEELKWEDLESKRACRIAVYRTGSIEDPQESLDQYHAWAIDQLLRLKRVFGPRLPGLSEMPE